MIVGLVVGGVVLLLIVIIIGTWISIFNSLVRLRNQAQNAWAQIDVQLKRRHDLIPNLVETVRGFATHEQKTLETVTAARYKAMNATSIPDKIKAEGELSGVLSRLMVISENYPDLKANQNFLSLQEELTSTENKLGFARQAYNDSVMRYNTRIETFPGNIVAGAKFRQEEYFEIENQAEREAPRVEF